MTDASRPSDLRVDHLRADGGMTWATATHDSPYGRIEVCWEQRGDALTVDVAVPPGTTADVVLPVGHARTLTSGRHTVSS